MVGWEPYIKMIKIVFVLFSRKRSMEACGLKEWSAFMGHWRDPR